MEREWNIQHPSLHSLFIFKAPKSLGHAALKIPFLLLLLHQKFTRVLRLHLSLCHTKFQETENCQIRLLPADKTLPEIPRLNSTLLNVRFRFNLFGFFGRRSPPT